MQLLLKHRVYVILDDVMVCLDDNVLCFLFYFEGTSHIETNISFLVTLHESVSLHQRLLWTHVKPWYPAAPHTRSSDKSVSLPRNQWRQNIKRQRKRERLFFFYKDKYCRVPERRGPHLFCRSRQRQTEITTSVVSLALILPHLSSSVMQSNTHARPAEPPSSPASTPTCTHEKEAWWVSMAPADTLAMKHPVTLPYSDRTGYVRATWESGRGPKISIF